MFTKVIFPLGYCLQYIYILFQDGFQFYPTNERIVIGDKGFTLLFKYVNATDSGDYTCAVS